MNRRALGLLFWIAGSAALLSGCGGGGGGGGSTQVVVTVGENPAVTPDPDPVVPGGEEVTEPETESSGVSYITSARGDTPPGPPQIVRY